MSNLDAFYFLLGLCSASLLYCALALYWRGQIGLLTFLAPGLFVTICWPGPWSASIARIAKDCRGGHGETKAAIMAKRKMN
jgi:fucose permease